MAINSGFRLRPVIPNPTGAFYGEVSDSHIDAATDAAIAEARRSLKKILEILIPAYQGKTMTVGGALAGIYVSSLADFFQENRAPEQKPDLKVYDEVVSAVAAKADHLKAIGLLTSLGFPPKAAAEMTVSGVKIFTID